MVVVVMEVVVVAMMLVLAFVVGVVLVLVDVAGDVLSPGRRFCRRRCCLRYSICRRTCEYCTRGITLVDHILASAVDPFVSSAVDPFCFGLRLVGVWLAWFGYRFVFFLCGSVRFGLYFGFGQAFRLRLSSGRLVVFRRMLPYPHCRSVSVSYTHLTLPTICSV